MDVCNVYGEDSVFRGQGEGKVRVLWDLAMATHRFFLQIRFMDVVWSKLAPFATFWITRVTTFWNTPPLKVYFENMAWLSLHLVSLVSKSFCLPVSVGPLLFPPVSCYSCCCYIFGKFPTYWTSSYMPSVCLCRLCHLSVTWSLLSTSSLLCPLLSFLLSCAIIFLFVVFVVSAVTRTLRCHPSCRCLP